MLATKMRMSGGGLSDNLNDWFVNIHVFQQENTHTNFNTITSYGSAGTHLYNAYRQSSGAQNDLVGWDIVLSAGTWTIELVYRKNTDGGIASVQLDDVEKGTIDMYAAGETNNSRDRIAGISVAVSGKTRLKIKMATKNASSSNYYGYLYHIQAQRTA